MQRWKDSGLSAKEYAAETGLNATTLANWYWKLSQPAVSATGDAVEPVPTQRVEQVPAHAVSSARFVEPRREASNVEASLLELVMSGGVRVPAGFDEATLIRLVRAVEAAR